MDRDRLKDIQTANLSEGQVNEDFVHWLKTKGPIYLLIFMIVIVGYMFYVRYQQGKDAHRAEAWIAFIDATASGLPASHEDVAMSYTEIDALYELGLLSAADGYLSSVIAGTAIGSNANITTSLSDEDRTFYLDKADGLYARLIDHDDNSPEQTLFIVSGLNGRAAVAESKGDIDSAKSYYESVITRASEQYPFLASQAQIRIDSLDALTEAIVLPSDAQVKARNNQTTQRDPAPINSTIDALTDFTELGK